jgi:hypothetical protein
LRNLSSMGASGVLKVMIDVPVFVGQFFTV